MESGSYKELQSNSTKTRFIAILITSLTLMTCLLIGVGTYLLATGLSDTPTTITKDKVIDEVIIVESVQPQEYAAKVIQHPAEIDFKEGEITPLEEAIAIEEIKSEARNNFLSENNPFIQTLVELSNNVASEIFSRFSENNEFSDIFGVVDDSEDSHRRERRSIPTALGFGALKYLNYLSFGRFMFNEVYSITEYAVEGRKLSGDPDAFFLDSGFWPESAQETENAVVEKVDNDKTAVESKPNRPPSAYDDGWTPMVNKVSLKFITDMLTTLLNLMREYLMRDNVMECLWYMFCKDMNHQAKYTDPMGYLARVNSVGLKVLTDKEGRNTDTIRGVWEALTQWQALDCDIMFPKCDGSKALEIVNEVANASRK